MKLFQELPTSDTVEDAERKEAEWLADPGDVSSDVPADTPESPAETAMFWSSAGIYGFMALMLRAGDPAPLFFLFCLITLLFIGIGKRFIERETDKPFSPGLIVIFSTVSCGLAAMMMSFFFPGADRIISIAVLIPIIVVSIYSVFCMVFFPAVRIVQIIKRRLRCSFRCKASLIFDQTLTDFKKYSYQYEGENYIISYRMKPQSNLVYRGYHKRRLRRKYENIPHFEKDVYGLALLIDPSEPTVFYDRSNALKQTAGCIIRMIIFGLFLYTVYPVAVSLINDII